MKQITEEDAKKVALYMGANNNLPDGILVSLGKEWFKTTHTNLKSDIIPTPREVIKAYKYLIGLGYRQKEITLTNQFKNY